jgi:putative heme-binding domain-containing protein
LLNATFRVGDAPEIRVGRQHLQLPWTPPTLPEPPAAANVPNLDGGDPARGAAVFAGDAAKCASCHKFKGQGGEVGPDLSDLVGRDRREVYRDIVEPSARIHPDYVPYVVATREGRVLAGTVRAEGADAIRVTDTEAKSTVIPRASIDQFRASGTSIMPVGLAGAIGEDRLRDLIAYLTTPPAR